MVGLVGIAISIVLDIRLTMHQVEEQVHREIGEFGTLKRVRELSKNDEIFLERYAELKREIGELAEGRYRINSLTSLYLDNIRCISELRPGERLLSTCPVSTVSETDAWRQLSAAAYVAAMKAHADAAMRGVEVIRIYLFRDRKMVAYEPIRKHLGELARLKIDLWILVRDEAKVEGDLDFLVYGRRKVSVGTIDPDTGMVVSAVIHTDPRIADFYAREYQRLKVISRRLEELVP
jgi:hypothetical protein